MAVTFAPIQSQACYCLSADGRPTLLTSLDRGFLKRLNHHFGAFGIIGFHCYNVNFP